MQVRVCRGLSALLMLCAVAAGAQTTGEVRATFVSGLSARLDSDGVHLNWRASEDVTAAAFLIYRHTQPLADATFDQATLTGTTPGTVTSFVDRPAPGDYFYAVIIQDQEGRRYPVFIPFRNRTSLALSVEQQLAPEDPIARIAGLTAELAGEEVLVSFSASQPGRGLLLFRSSSPLHSTGDLVAASSPVSISSSETQFRDFPIPGVDYYYALVDAELFRVGNVDLTPGQNATVAPVRVALGEARPEAPTSRQRPLPLPFLLISQGIDSDAQLPPIPVVFPARGSVRPETAKAITELLSRLQPVSGSAPQVEVLAQERAAQGGEQLALQRIVTGALVGGDYARAEELLERFLTLRRTAEVEARAQFYLAQSYFFQKRFRESVNELLLAGSLYPDAAQRWLDENLNQLQATGN